MEGIEQTTNLPAPATGEHEIGLRTQAWSTSQQELCPSKSKPSRGATSQSATNPPTLSLAERVARQRDLIIGEHVYRGRYQSWEHSLSLKSQIDRDSVGQNETVQRMTAGPPSTPHSVKQQALSSTESNVGILSGENQPSVLGEQRATANPFGLSRLQFSFEPNDLPERTATQSAIYRASDLNKIVRSSSIASSKHITQGSNGLEPCINGQSDPTVSAMLQQSTRSHDPGEPARRQYRGRATGNSSERAATPFVQPSPPVPKSKINSSKLKSPKQILPDFLSKKTFSQDPGAAVRHQYRGSSN